MLTKKTKKTKKTVYNKKLVKDIKVFLKKKKKKKGNMNQKEIQIY